MQAVLEILPFMDKMDLWKHPHFKGAAPARRYLGMMCPGCMLGGCLTCLSHSCLVRAVGARSTLPHSTPPPLNSTNPLSTPPTTQVKPFVMGALLTGASMAVHKEGHVLLSSLTHGFNAGLPAFQVRVHPHTDFLAALTMNSFKAV